MLEKIKRIFTPACMVRIKQLQLQAEDAQQRLEDACKNLPPAPFMRPHQAMNDFSHVADLRHIRNPS